MGPSVRAGIIEDRIGSIAAQLGKSSDVAFLHLIYSLLFDVDYSEVEFEDVIEGSAEKGIDIIRIDEDELEGARVSIVQVKNHVGFSSDAVVKLANGLDWIFNQPKVRYNKIKNIRLVSKIAEIRDLHSRLGPSNLDIFVCFATKGSTQNLPSEVKDEVLKIKQKYQGVYSSFDFRLMGADELVDALNQQERAARRIDDRLKILFNVNRSTLIHYEGIGDPKGVVCTVPGSEIARLVSGEGRSAIFDRNIRQYLGRKRVNENILSTASDPDEGKLFWFYNNGITMVCDDYDVSSDPDNPQIMLNNVQIVNGCQTAVSIQKAQEDGRLRPDVHVLVRVYATRDRQFSEKITVTTNNQNVIRARDLKANDRLQEDMQRAFKERYQYLYERKVNEFRHISGADRKRIINNEKLGQAYLAVVLRMLVAARAQKYKVFGEHYEAIFRAKNIDRHMLAYLLYTYCAAQKASMVKKHKSDGLMYSAVTNGVFHVARVVAYLLFGGDEWKDSEVAEKIGQIQKRSDTLLRRLYERATTMLRRILAKNAGSYTSPNNFFKTAEMERLIDQALKGKQPRRSRSGKGTAKRRSAGR